MPAKAKNNKEQVKDGIVKKAIKHRWSKKLKKSMKSMTAHCEVCRIFYPSKKELHDHMSTISHHEKLDERYGVNAIHMCFTCKWTCNNVKEYARHLASEEHCNIGNTTDYHNKWMQWRDGMVPQQNVTSSLTNKWTVSYNNNFTPNSSKDWRGDQGFMGDQRGKSFNWDQNIFSDQRWNYGYNGGQGGFNNWNQSQSYMWQEQGVYNRMWMRSDAWNQQGSWQQGSNDNMGGNRRNRSHFDGCNPRNSQGRFMASNRKEEASSVSKNNEGSAMRSAKEALKKVTETQEIIKTSNVAENRDESNSRKSVIHLANVVKSDPTSDCANKTRPLPDFIPLDTKTKLAPDSVSSDKALSIKKSRVASTKMQKKSVKSPLIVSRQSLEGKDLTKVKGSIRKQLEAVPSEKLLKRTDSGAAGNVLAKLINHPVSRKDNFTLNKMLKNLSKQKKRPLSLAKAQEDVIGEIKAVFKNSNEENCEDSKNIAAAALPNNEGIPKKIVKNVDKRLKKSREVKKKAGNADMSSSNLNTVEVDLSKDDDDSDVISLEKRDMKSKNVKTPETPQAKPKIKKSARLLSKTKSLHSVPPESSQSYVTPVRLSQTIPLDVSETQSSNQTTCTPSSASQSDITPQTTRTHPRCSHLNADPIRNIPLWCSVSQSHNPTQTTPICTSISQPHTRIQTTPSTMSVSVLQNYNTTIPSHTSSLHPNGPYDRQPLSHDPNRPRPRDVNQTTTATNSYKSQVSLPSFNQSLVSSSVTAPIATTSIKQSTLSSHVVQVSHINTHSTVTPRASLSSTSTSFHNSLKSTGPLSESTPQTTHILHHTKSLGIQFSPTLPVTISAAKTDTPLSLNNNLSLLTSNNQPMLSSNNPPMLSSNKPPMLSSNNPPLLSSNNPPMLTSNDPRLMPGNHPQQISTNNPQQMSTNNPPVGLPAHVMTSPITSTPYTSQPPANFLPPSAMQQPPLDPSNPHHVPPVHAMPLFNAPQSVVHQPPQNIPPAHSAISHNVNITAPASNVAPARQNGKNGNPVGAILDISLKEEEVRRDMVETNGQIDAMRRIISDYIARLHQLEAKKIHLLRIEENLRGERLKLLHAAVESKSKDTEIIFIKEEALSDTEATVDATNRTTVTVTQSNENKCETSIVSSLPTSISSYVTTGENNSDGNIMDFDDTEKPPTDILYIGSIPTENDACDNVEYLGSISTEQNGSDSIAYLGSIPLEKRAAMKELFTANLTNVSGKEKDLFEQLLKFSDHESRIESESATTMSDSSTKRSEIKSKAQTSACSVKLTKLPECQSEATFKSPKCVTTKHAGSEIEVTSEVGSTKKRMKSRKERDKKSRKAQMSPADSSDDNSHKTKLKNSRKATVADASSDDSLIRCKKETPRKLNKSRDITSAMSDSLSDMRSTRGGNKKLGAVELGSNSHDLTDEARNAAEREDGSQNEQLVNAVANELEEVPVKLDPDLHDWVEELLASDATLTKDSLIRAAPVTPDVTLLARRCPRRSFVWNSEPIKQLLVRRESIFILYACGRAPTRFSMQFEHVFTYDKENSLPTCMLTTETSESLFFGVRGARLIAVNIFSGRVQKAIPLASSPECLIQDGTGCRLYVGLNTGIIVIYSLVKNNVTRAFRVACESITALCMAKEGQRPLLCVASRDSVISVVNANSGLLLRSLNAHSRPAVCMQVTNSLLWSGTEDSHLLVHDIHNGDMVAVKTGTESAIIGIQVVAVGGCDTIVVASQDGYIKLYDPKTQLLECVYYGKHREPITAMTVCNNRVYTANSVGLVEELSLNAYSQAHLTCQNENCDLVFALHDDLLEHYASHHPG